MNTSMENQTVRHVPPAVVHVSDDSEMYENMIDILTDHYDKTSKRTNSLTQTSDLDEVGAVQDRSRERS